MILKIMGSEDMFDDFPEKSCRIISNVSEVNFYREGTGEAALEVNYSVPNRKLSSEHFILTTNAYLMNDNGKTINTYSPN